MPRPLGAACPQGHRQSGRAAAVGFCGQAFRAHDGCLGGGWRRRTRQAAIFHGEAQAARDPWVSEWGNPAGRSLRPRPESIGPGGDTGGSETSQYPEEQKSNEIPPVAASERGLAQTGGFIPRGWRTRKGPADGSAGAWKGAPERVTAPCAKPCRRRAGILSRAGHVKPRPNPGGPPPKAEYKPPTDSARVP